jgi:transcriptional regulator with XRE-family HTH domain
MQDTLARKLRVLRAERGLTLREAEQLTGVDKDTLSKIERGLRHPYDVTLSKLAKGYGVPVEELLEEPVPLGEFAGRDLPNSIEELLERRHTETRHLADPNLAATLAALPIEDHVRVVREVGDEIVAINPDLVYLRTQYSHDPQAWRLSNDAIQRFLIARWSLRARRGQQIEPASPELEAELDETIREAEEVDRVLAEV